MTLTPRRRLKKPFQILFSDFNVKEKVDWYTMDTFTNFTCSCPDQCLQKFPRQDLSREIHRHFMLKEYQLRVMCQCMLACCVSRLAGDHKTGIDQLRRAKRAKILLETSGETRPTKSQFLYQFLSQKCCKKTFMRILCVGLRIMRSSQSAVRQGIAYPAMHMRGQHRQGSRSGKRILQGIFLENMANLYALPDPTGRGSKPDKPVPVMFFPPSYTVKKIYQDYKDSRIGAGLTSKPLKYLGFLHNWRVFHPHIRIRNPRTDICKTCDDLRLSRDQISLDAHRSLAVIERTAFNQSVKDSRNNVANDSIQLTFDYAQKILIPLYGSDQPGPIFYVAGLKMDLFGIANNTTGVQHNFVLPEGHWPQAKTSSPIISMLTYYIDTNLPHVKFLKLMADNCSGQNKNRWMIWILAWLVVEKSIETIDYFFLIVGHIKIFCDACFGLCKRSLKGKDILTPEEVIKCFANSAKCNRVVTADAVDWIDYKSFIELCFCKEITGIMSFQHFRFEKQKPGIALYKRYASDEVWLEKNLLKRDVTISMIKDPESYGLHNLQFYKLKSTEMELTSERRAYFDKEVVKIFFVGDRTYAKDKYFLVK